MKTAFGPSRPIKAIVQRTRRSPAVKEVRSLMCVTKHWRPCASCHKLSGPVPQENLSPAMIHNVYFWLKKDLPAADRATFESELIKLKEISYLVHGFVGRPAPTEARPVTDHSFDYS